MPPGSTVVPSRLQRTHRASIAGVAALATTGVVGALAAPALAATGRPAVEDTGLTPGRRHRRRARRPDRRPGRRPSSSRRGRRRQGEGRGRGRRPRGRPRPPRSKAKAEREAKERAAREAERKRLNTFVAPIAGSYVSTGYQAGGGLWSSGSHTGVDFHAASGTAVHAVGSGTVVEAGWGGAYGNNVVIKMNDGTYTQYGHLSSIGVSVGQTVTPGQQIGLSGATGNVTGPHLHFEARTTAEYGSDIDPVAYLRSHGVNV